MTDEHLKAFITTQGIAAELVYAAAPTPTVSAAAQALDVPAERIVKSLVFIADGVPVLVVAAGESRISHRRLRDVLGVARKRLRMATAQEALTITGFEVGAMPPFGHGEPLPTLLDSLTVTPEAKVLFGGGGTKTAMLKVDYDTLVNVTQARCLPLTTMGSSATALDTTVPDTVNLDTADLNTAGLNTVDLNTVEEEA
jgi:prolyl-tRNA editing enzyme YbaK/EbsC (Cys-tRNA(Pro) deacylase)